MKNGLVRWAINTSNWSPTRSEWTTGMRLVDSEEERIKINRYVFKKDAKQALVGRLLIRKVCHAYLGAEHFSFSRDPQNVDKWFIQRSEKGKPLLVQGKLGFASHQDSCLNMFVFDCSH